MFGFTSQQQPPKAAQPSPMATSPSAQHHRSASMPADSIFASLFPSVMAPTPSSPAPNGHRRHQTSVQVPFAAAANILKDPHNAPVQAANNGGWFTMPEMPAFIVKDKGPSVPRHAYYDEI